MFKKLRIEKSLIKKGHRYICGVDEVGMSPFAGGFAVCALILDLENSEYIKDIDDSKQLTKIKRRELEPTIIDRAIDYSIVFVPVSKINRAYKKVKGMSGSFRRLHLEAMKQAVLNLKVKPDVVITDCFRIPDLPFPQKPIKGGDKESATIAGASILAKCYRERIMENLASKVKGYEHWASTCGNWSIRELIALHTIGPTKYHRIDFIENALNCKSGNLRKDNKGNYYLNSSVNEIHKKQYYKVAEEYGLKLK